ncbi:MAG: hypothetical protein AAB337_03535, partial [Patescibacteria group bacterium]
MPTASEAIELKNAWKHAPRGKNGNILPFADWPQGVLVASVKRTDGSVTTFGALNGLEPVANLTVGVSCPVGEYWSKTWGWCVGGTRADYQAMTESRMFGELRRADAGLKAELDSSNG